MPLLTLTTWPALTDPGQQQDIAHELGDHTARLLHKRLPVTAVAISGAPVAWFIGCGPLQDHGAATPRTFALEIRIVEIPATDWGYGGRPHAARVQHPRGHS